MLFNQFQNSCIGSLLSHYVCIYCIYVYSSLVLYQSHLVTQFFFTDCFVETHFLRSQFVNNDPHQSTIQCLEYNLDNLPGHALNEGHKCTVLNTHWAVTPWATLANNVQDKEQRYSNMTFCLISVTRERLYVHTDVL